MLLFIAYRLQYNNLSALQYFTGNHNMDKTGHALPPSSRLTVKPEALEPKWASPLFPATPFSLDSRSFRHPECSLRMKKV